MLSRQRSNLGAGTPTCFAKVAVLVDPGPTGGREPGLLFLLTHEVKFGRRHRHLQATAIRSCDARRKRHVFRRLGTILRFGTSITPETANRR